MEKKINKQTKNISRTSTERNLLFLSTNKHAKSLDTEVLTHTEIYRNTVIATLCWLREALEAMCSG